MPKTRLPAAAAKVAERYPAVWNAFADLGKKLGEAGPLDAKTRRLVKLALAVGDGSEGGVHSHVRRGLEEGISPEELRQVALLGISTIGFPNAVAAMTWIDDLVGVKKDE